MALPDPKPPLREEDVPELNLLRWTAKEDEALRKFKKEHGRFTKRFLAFHTLLSKRSHEACQNRWRYLAQSKKVASNNKKWTPAQVADLKKAIAELTDRGVTVNNGFWPKVAEKVEGRSGKQCREKWVNHFDPKYIRSPWSQPQRDLLLVLVNNFAHSKTKWKKISDVLNRSPDACKNQYHVLKKKV